MNGQYIFKCYAITTIFNKYLAKIKNHIKYGK